MICYDEKIKKKNLESCRSILKAHSRCMQSDESREARECYCRWCDMQLSEKTRTEVRYMDIVEKTYDMLVKLNEWSEDWKLRKANQNLYMIQPFTNFSICLFPVVGESK